MGLMVAALLSLSVATPIAAATPGSVFAAPVWIADESSVDMDCTGSAYACGKAGWIAYQAVAGEEQQGPGDDDAVAQDEPEANAEAPRAADRTLPFLAKLARERGYDLPLPLGAGAVYYFLSRDVEVSDVRVGRNGAPPESVSQYAVLSASSEVDNVNLKFDAWLLPFLNLYAIAGYVNNETNVRMDVTLPPLLPNGDPRTRSLQVPTALEGPVAGLGMTLAGGYKQFFFAADINAARIDLGFDDRFEAVVKSFRIGFNGHAGERPLRVWVNVTYWDTYFEVKGTVPDPDGGTLDFEVDQGPAEPWTYGVGMQYTVRPTFELAADVGWDFDGGWYVAIVPVIRF